MKIQLDTTNKTIKIEESVNLNELFELLNKILPNDTWKEFKLETNTIINWNSTPIIIKKEIWPTYPWWQQPQVMYNNKLTNPYSVQDKLEQGNYNIEY
jgi:hypothetical protein